MKTLVGSCGLVGGDSTSSTRLAALAQPPPAPRFEWAGVVEMQLERAPGCTEAVYVAKENGERSGGGGATRPGSSRTPPNTHLCGVFD